MILSFRTRFAKILKNGHYTKFYMQNLLLSHFFINFANDMPIEFHIDIVDTIIKGLIIGVLASAPMGPVGILCVQRTLNKGRWYGFVTGLGATASDLFYATITGVGMSFVMDIVNNSSYRFYLQILGSLMLLAFGIISYRSNPTKNMHRSGYVKGTLIHNGVTAFLVTISNPLIILLFMACFAQFAFIIPDQPFVMAIGFLSIVAGAILWWYGLTWLIDKIRTNFQEYGIVLINRLIGALVIAISVIILFGTVFNLFTIHY